jgi:exonuclease III
MAYSQIGRPFNLLQWNCRSIRDKKHFLRHFLETHDVQIFALQETWLKEDESFSIPGFNIMRKGGLIGYRGGGVMIGIKNGIEFKKTQELGTDSCELVGAEILIDHGQKVNVFSVYCAPGWGLNSREVGDALAVVSNPMLVLGDFNTHVAQPVL